MVNLTISSLWHTLTAPPSLGQSENKAMRGAIVGRFGAGRAAELVSQVRSTSRPPLLPPTSAPASAAAAQLCCCCRRRRSRAYLPLPPPQNSRWTTPWGYLGRKRR